MYEQIDSLYSWAIQHNAQEILGILALCLAVLVPIAAIVLASVDAVLDYALRYINEDRKSRFLIKEITRENKENKYPASARYLEHASWSFRHWSKLSQSLRQELSDLKDDLIDLDGDLPTFRLRSMLYGDEFYIYKASFISKLVTCLCGIAATLYFLPLWLIVTGATIYGTLLDRDWETYYVIGM